MLCQLWHYLHNLTYKNKSFCWLNFEICCLIRSLHLYIPIKSPIDMLNANEFFCLGRREMQIEMSWRSEDPDKSEELVISRSGVCVPYTAVTRASLSQYDHRWRNPLASLGCFPKPSCHKLVVHPRWLMMSAGVGVITTLNESVWALINARCLAVNDEHGIWGLILIFLSYFALFPDSVIDSLLRTRARSHTRTLQKLRFKSLDELKDVNDICMYSK